MGSSKLGTDERPLWVAIIGAGPAAYFTAGCGTESPPTTNPSRP
jgi:hypothetical protein